MSEAAVTSPRGLIDALSLTSEQLSGLVDPDGRARSAPADLHAVAVLDFAPTRLPRAAWIAAAARLGAGVVGSSDLPPGGDAWTCASEAAHWCERLVLSHPDAGFAAAVSVATGRAVVNAGEIAGSDPLVGLGVLEQVLVAVREMGEVRAPRVAVCGDLRGSATARGVLGALAAVHAELLLVPTPGRGLDADLLQRLASRVGRPPLRFEARALSTLLDVVDTVLLTERVPPQLPLFPVLGLPPGDHGLRARRQVEDADAMFVAGATAADDRLLLHPFRGDAATEVDPVASLAPDVLARVLLWDAPQLAPDGLNAASVGLRCRADGCHAARNPRVRSLLRVVDPDHGQLECGYCARTTSAEFVASRRQWLLHPVGSAVARRIHPENRVFFRSLAEGLESGVAPTAR